MVVRVENASSLRASLNACNETQLYGAAGSFRPPWDLTTSVEVISSLFQSEVPQFRNVKESR